MTVTKVIYDMRPEEKEWLENTIMPSTDLTRIGLLRALLDDYAKKNKLPARPGKEKGK